ncbi:hypothetical protein [Methanolobus halotolerans]|uniref:Uncharacterized protein n=1 Tax=Methanolobus halotolerans TaxID=2052935 RepID=A0A4E0PTK7_9EURY|nr:hypothetical protein [Methanolobus halotolerans]TGC08130.1 hypothetical protein CUN85_09920 [Methanolobus halotolerans]
MGIMYSWATPDHLLNQMSMNQVMLYYEKGIKAIELQARIFWGVLGEALSGQEKVSETDNGDKPDLDRFYELYGNRIKRR